MFVSGKKHIPLNGGFMGYTPTENYSDRTIMEGTAGFFVPFQPLLGDC